MWETKFKSGTTLRKCVEDKQRKFIKLNYYPKITEKLHPVLRKHNLAVAYSSTLKLKNLLGTAKDKVDDMEKSGIYKIRCDGCDKFYIGMTKRKIRQRLQDHLSDIKSGKETTALSKHVKEENSALGRGRRHQKKHGISNKNIKIIKEVYNYKELCVWETVKILKNIKGSLNDNNGFGESSLTKIFMTTTNSG